MSVGVRRKDGIVSSIHICWRGLSLHQAAQRDRVIKHKTDLIFCSTLIAPGDPGNSVLVRSLTFFCAILLLNVILFHSHEFLYGINKILYSGSLHFSESLLEHFVIGI